MLAFLDQLGNTIHLSKYPERIISLVPSLTELLFDLGLDDEIVGVTRYCVFPKHKVANRIKVGGIKQFDFPVIDGLKPDLIIGNKEENYREGILQLQEKYPVWVSDIITVDDALHMIKRVGELVNRSQNADQLLDEISSGLAPLDLHPRLRAAYLIWKNPYMVAAGNTFINKMLQRCGFINIFEGKNRYPQITLDELVDADVVLLSSEPYTFDVEDIENIRKRYPSQQVCFVDGTIFSWYGSRLKLAARYFAVLHEQLRQGYFKPNSGQSISTER